MDWENATRGIMRNPRIISAVFSPLGIFGRFRT